MKINKFKEYFEKLNIVPSKASLQLVENIQKKHLETFSFNNIAVLLKQNISLSIDDILNKIVKNNLGGYCFEHNKLMYEVLKSLGFEVRILIAKVINNQNVDTPRTHRVTLLKFENKQYLIDVGFGSYCPQVPICIDDKNDNQKYRITKINNIDYQLELKTFNKYFILYTLNLYNYTEADCIMGNFYSSNYKDAVFLNNFVVSLKFKNYTYSLRNYTYHKVYKDKTDITMIKDYIQIYEILRDDFNISISKIEAQKLFNIVYKIKN